MMDPSPYRKIRVTNVIDPTNFHAQIDSEERLKEFAKFESRLGDHVVVNADPDELNIGQSVIVKKSDDTYRRASVAGVLGDEEALAIDVWYMDYGISEQVDPDQVYDLPENIHMDWPPVSLCQLAGVRPIAPDWISRAVMRFKEMTEDKVLDAHIVQSPYLPSFPLEIFIEDEDRLLSVRDVLIDEGLAMPIEDDHEVLQDNQDQNEDEDEPVEKVTTVPEFKTDLLEKVPVKPPVKEEVQRDFEREVFTRGIDSSKHLSYEPSDVTITTQFRPNTRHDAYIDTQQEIIQVQSSVTTSGSSDTVDSEDGREGRRLTRRRRGNPRGRRHPVEAIRREHQHHRPRSNSPVKPSIPYTREGNSAERIRQENHQGAFNQGHEKIQGGFSQGTKTTLLKQSNSPSHSPSRAATAPPDQNKPQPPADPSRGYRSKVKMSLTQEEMLKNEYDWFSGQFTYKVNLLLDKICHEQFDIYAKELLDMVHTDDSKLRHLPGHGELYLCLHAFIKRALTVGQNFFELALCCIALFSEVEEFSENIGNALDDFQADYIKAPDQVKEERQLFCHFLAALYIAAQSWPDSIAIHFYLIKTLENWVDSSQKTQDNSHENMEVYAECLETVLLEVGPHMQHLLPTELKNLTKCIKDRLTSSSTLTMGVRHHYLSILLREAAAWGVLPEESEQQQTETSDCECQTNHIQTKDIGMVTEFVWMPNDGLPESDNGKEQDQHQVAPVDQNPFAQVEQMLQSLRLQDLQKVFIENAIVDDALEVDFEDLKEIFLHCGLLPGQIVRIKHYLKNKAVRPVAAKQVIQESRKESVPEPNFFPGNDISALEKSAAKSELMTPDSFTVAKQQMCPSSFEVDHTQYFDREGSADSTQGHFLNTLRDVGSDNTNVNSTSYRDETSQANQSSAIERISPFSSVGAAPACKPTEASSKDPKEPVHPSQKYNFKSIFNMVEESLQTPVSRASSVSNDEGVSAGNTTEIKAGKNEVMKDYTGDWFRSGTKDKTHVGDGVRNKTAVMTSDYTDFKENQKIGVSDSQSDAQSVGQTSLYARAKDAENDSSMFIREYTEEEIRQFNTPLEEPVQPKQSQRAEDKKLKKITSSKQKAVPLKSFLTPEAEPPVPSTAEPARAATSSFGKVQYCTTCGATDHKYTACRKERNMFYD